MSDQLSQLTNIRFVDEVKKYPILYNNQLPGYSNRHETEKAWQEVANKMKLSAFESRDRWKNIRSVFCRHLKAAESKRRVRPYYLAEALKFIVPFIKKKETSGDQTQDPLEEEEVFIYADDDDDDNSLSDIPTDIQPSSPSFPPPSKSPPSSSTSALVQHQAKRKRPAMDNNVGIDLNEYLDFGQTTSSAKCEQETTEPRKEALRMFLLSMLPDLMQMDDQEVRQFKKMMLNAVDDILSAKSKRFINNKNST